MKTNSPLICFALKEEAAPFRKTAAGKSGVSILITGMGAKNTEKSFRDAIVATEPGLVITAGFAGGLNPQYTVGTVVFDEDSEAGFDANLLEAGAVKGRFLCVPRVATTAAEKWQLWQSSGADAVEMESEIIRRICRENKIPGATVRVISDSAGEDLPMDFNALMTADDRLDYFKLVKTLLGNPGKIPQLMRFQRQTALAARNLGEVLNKSLAGLR